MTGDVLMPVLITFLIVNVILIIRVWARGRLERTRALATGPLQRALRADGPAAPVPAAPVPAASVPAAAEPELPAPALVMAEEVTSVPGLTAALPETEPAPVAVAPADGGAPAAPAQVETETPLMASAVAETETSLMASALGEEPASSASDATEAPAAAKAASGPAPVVRPRDPLPGLDDETAWDRRVADENARLVRYRRSVTMVRVELDGLDRLVGLLGDEAGGRLLRAMADTLRRLARDTDHVAYLGNGGFAVLMPETSEDAAVRYVARVSRACELWLESAAVAVRLSIGWASTSGETSLVDVQRLATEQMTRGPWPGARQAGTPAAQAPASRASVAQAPATSGTTRPLAPEPPQELAPRRSWETCRDPDCNHKDDHRRDRRS